MNRPAQRAMDYEVAESREYPEHWHVEAIDEEGRICVAVFSGPCAKTRALEYADWKNGVKCSSPVLNIVRR